MTLIQNGWTLPEIDAMDIHFFFELEDEMVEESSPKVVPIDRVF